MLQAEWKAAYRTLLSHAQVAWLSHSHLSLGLKLAELVSPSKVEHFPLSPCRVDLYGTQTIKMLMNHVFRVVVFTAHKMFLKPIFHGLSSFQKLMMIHALHVFQL